MLDSLGAVVLAAHLLLVNVAMSAPLLALWLEMRATRRGDLEADRIGKRLAAASQWSLAMAIGLGGVLAWLVWREPSQAYWRAVAHFPRSRLWFGLGELLFYFACMGAYVGLWDRLRERRWLHRLFSVLAVTNLWYHFPPLFAMLAHLAGRPDLLAEPLDRSAVYALMTSGEVMSRVVHVWLASLAVGGIHLTWLASETRAPAQADIDAPRPIVSADSAKPTTGEHVAPPTHSLAVAGGRFALAATIAQLPVGLWVLLQLPDGVREALLGRDLWLASAFWLALAAVLRLLHQLAAIALGDASRQGARAAIGTMVVIVLLMTLVLRAADRRGLRQSLPDTRGEAANASTRLWQRGIDGGSRSVVVADYLPAAR